MKIQFRNIKLPQEQIDLNGELLNLSYIDSSGPNGNTTMSQEIELDYDNLSVNDKQVVDNFINLLKNSL